MIGVINAHMIGTEAAPGEHVDWSTPDYFTHDDFADLVGVDVATYAEQNRHMILFVTDLVPVTRFGRRVWHCRRCDTFGSVDHDSGGVECVELARIKARS